MTKKQNPFEEAEIDQDSEPLKFEEATSLFEDENSSEVASKEATQEVETKVEETSQIQEEEDVE